ncbi:hypothetical protein [Pontibacter mucosus]|nr:hypothetical protein [Pontibacter mucosus]
MNLETIFKLSLVILAIAIVNYFDVEKGPMQTIFLSLFPAYLMGRYLYLRRIIKQNSQDIFVLKKNDWILAMMTWAVLAVMALNNLSGIHLIANMLLLAGVMALVAVNESTDVYLIKSASNN